MICATAKEFKTCIVRILIVKGFAAYTTGLCLYCMMTGRHFCKGGILISAFQLSLEANIVLYSSVARLMWTTVTIDVCKCRLVCSEFS